MGIAVLGPLTIDDSGALGRRDRIILQALVARAGRPVSTDQLVDAVWGDRPPASAAKNLQGCVVRLRRLLGQDAIVTSSHGYQLVLPADEVDVHRFERSVARSRELLLLGEHDRAAFQLTEALALWRGEPFDDLEGWAGVETEVRHLHELRLDAEELRIEALLAGGRHREVLAEAQTMVGAAPLRERRWALLAHAQYLAGRQGDALRTIHQLKAVLAEHLGIDPGPDVLALETAILRQDDSLLGSTTAGEARATCPYQGLLAYELDDVDRFFGRESDVEACLRVLRRSPMLALVGPSGSGKSSLLRAGLAAALRELGQASLVITPGRHPLKVWTDCAGAPPSTVLLVDQFEEVFTICEDPGERDEFIAALVAELDSRTVVIALRSDRLADLAAHPDLGRHAEEGLHLVAGLDEEGLRQAVEAPARQAGLHLEPGLVDLLVREVEGDPGALPLFSHALLETWKRREGNTLTVDGYRATGGIHGAVAQSAERLYAQTDREHRPMLRDLVLRLVSPGPDGEAVRTRVPRRLIAADPDHDQMIDALVAARLVTSDEGALEITHEALARAWPRLRAWLDDDVEGQRLLHHLSASADAWDSMGRPDSELYRGVRLVRALDWQDRTTSALTDTEREFLDRARAVADIEERTALERVRTQSRLIRRLRIVLAGAAILLVGALVAGALAVHQADRAEDNSARALANETSAVARRAGAQALITDDIEESMLLAVAGVQLDDSPATRSSLQAALARRPELVGSTPIGGERLNTLDVSPDGLTVATYDSAHRVRLHRLDTGELLGEYSAGSTRPRSGTLGRVIFSPAGGLVAAEGAPPSREPVRLLDSSTLSPVAAQPRGLGGWRWQVGDLAFSQDGRRVAAVLTRVEGPVDALERTSGWAVAWDLADLRRPVARVRLADKNVYGGVALSPDGSVMFTTSPLVRHDIARSTSRVVTGASDLRKLSMSPDGHLLVGSTAKGGLALLDWRTGARRDVLGAGESAWHVAVSDDSSRVASVLFEAYEAVVWDAATGAEVARIPIDEGPEILDLSSDGSVLYAAGSAGSVRHWDVDGDRRFLSQVAADKDRISSYLPALPAPTGQLLAVPSLDDVGFLDLRTNTTPSAPLDDEDTAPGLGSWHPDGVHFAHAGDRITVWDGERARVVGRTGPSEAGISGIDHSTDGSRLVVAEPSGRVTMLDALTLEPVGRVVRLGKPTCCVSAAPDNRTAIVLTGSLDTTGFFSESVTGWTVVDLESGIVVNQGELGFEGRALDVSPDGGQVAVGGRDGEVLLLDLVTGAPLAAPTIVAHGSIDALSYARDGRRVLASGGAATVSVLDARTGRVTAQVASPEPGTTAVFGEDPEEVLIASSGDGPVWRWDTGVDRALGLACRVAGREFTEAEWATHFPGHPYRSVCPHLAP